MRTKPTPPRGINPLVRAPGIHSDLRGPSGARILLIEDEEKTARAIVRGLETEGFAACWAETGEEGFFLLNSERFDALVLDWMLPGRTGLEVLKTLRTKDVKMPVLLLTARDALDDRIAGLDGGADDYLVKSFALAELAARLRALLRRAAADSAIEVPNPYDELGQLAVVFNATLARLENSFSELRRFTADASHELRTPLTPLRAVGEAVLRLHSEDAESLREALSSMLEETRRLSDLVEDLLLLARADTGGALQLLQDVELESLVQEVRETILVLPEEKSQCIEVQAEKLIVLAERDLLHLALLNLVDNAIRYSPEGLSIHLRVRRDEQNAVIEELKSSTKARASRRSTSRKSLSAFTASIKRDHGRAAVPVLAC